MSLIYILFITTVITTMTTLSAPHKNLAKIKVISLDITGTLLIHKEPIMETYASAASWALLPNSPTADELKPAFKQAYKENLLKSPCFRNDLYLYSSRQWWVATVRRTLELCNRNYTDKEFNRFFRRVYQHYGSLNGYELLADTLPFLEFLEKNRPEICLGITTNTPVRSVETVLPMMGLHNRFKFFVWYIQLVHDHYMISCQDVGAEKPNPLIFQETYEQAQFWTSSDLRKDEVLHIGDNLAADLCGTVLLINHQ